MSASVRRAEELALTGDSYEEDTQVIADRVYEKMRWAENQPTSSSPTRPKKSDDEELTFSQHLEESSLFEPAPHSQMLEVPFTSDNSRPGTLPNAQNLTSPSASKTTQRLPPGWKIRHEAGKILVFDEEGNPQKHLPKKMSSGGSTTQELTQSYYEQEKWARENPSQASQAKAPVGSTSQDDAAGLVDLMQDFDEDAEASQDPHGVIEDEEAETQIAVPDTPALPPAPHHFNQSHHMVVAPSQLFNETSPPDQAPASILSQRPSPDIYSADNIVSPEKKGPDSSPLARSSSSFNNRPRNRLSKYSIRQNKHAREMAADPPAGSHFSDDSDEDAEETRRRKARENRKRAEREAEEQYARVSGPARSNSMTNNRSDELSPNAKSASEKPVVTEADDDTEDEEPESPKPMPDADDTEDEKPQSPKLMPDADDDTEDEQEQIPEQSIAVPGSVETPGRPGPRRRSLADDYIAQTNGTDARDTQEDMVIDSQVLPALQPSSNAFQDEAHEFENGSKNDRSPLPKSPVGSGIPLSELSPNARKTPRRRKGSSNQDLVLETSPVALPPLRTMAEVAGEEQSPIEDDQFSLSAVPGFTMDTQDREFDDAMHGSSPAPQVLQTSSLRGPVNPSQALPLSGVRPVDVDADAVVLETPQPSNVPQENFLHDDVASKEPPASSISESASGAADPESPNPEVSHKVSRKRRNSSVEERPSKRTKTYGKAAQRSSARAQSSSTEVQTNMTTPSADMNDLQPPSDTADTGYKYSTAPEVARAGTSAKSGMNYGSAQSSALTELDDASVTTPEAFRETSPVPNIPQNAAKLDDESVATSEASKQPSPAHGVPQDVVDPVEASLSGPVKDLKRKRATDTPILSLKRKPVVKNIKTCPKPSSTVAKATPKVLKDLKGAAASSTRSSTRRASSGSTKGKSTNVASRESTPSTRSSNRLSAAPSSLGANSVTPSTPFKDKVTIAAGKSGGNESRSGLFCNMAFAVSYVSHDKQKEDVLGKIHEEGGFVLEQGFDELFAVDTLPLTPSRSKRGAKKDADSMLKDLENLKPNAKANRITFACVIADEHSRRSKYMQALSLDLPCLHGRWIIDCVAQQRVLDWIPYLLCSGESTLLDGALHSRVLAPYSAESANFSEHFDSGKRMRLLHGKKVLVVVGTTKTMVDNRKAYVFITQALGAEVVGTVPDTAAAREILVTDAGREKWDWVYVDKNEDLGQAALDETQRAKGKKSNKRKSNAVEADDDDEGAEAQTAAWLEAKVVGDQFIIQSLILGRLLNDDKLSAAKPSTAKPSSAKTSAASAEPSHKVKGKSNAKRAKGKGGVAGNDGNDDEEDDDDEDELS